MKGRILGVAAVVIGIAVAILWPRPAGPTGPAGGPPAGAPASTAPPTPPVPTIPSFPAPPAAVSLAGIVVDEETGAPIGNAPVRVRLLGEGNEPVGLRMVRTVQDGTFLIERLPAGSFLVRAGWESAEGAGTHDAADAVPVTGGTADLRIALRKGRPLAGRVLAADGTRFRGPFWVLSGIPVPGSNRALHGRKVLFDNGGDDGVFRLPHVRAGVHDLEVFPGDAGWPHPGYGTLRLRGIPAGTEGIEARFHQAGTIGGMVEDEDGLPVPAAEILAFPAGERRSLAMIGGGVQENGTFSTGLLDRRFHYDLVFTRLDAARGVRQWGLARDVAPGTKGHRVVLGGSVPLTGRVERASGAPVGRGIPVRATFADYDIQHAESVETEADGTFAFRGLGTPGAFRIRVWAGGGSGCAPALAPLPASPGDPPLVVRVGPGEAISGTLWYRAGVPLRGARIRVGPGTGEWPFPWEVSGRCDFEGRFRIGDLPAGPVRILCEVGASWTACPIVASPGDGYDFVEPWW